MSTPTNRLFATAAVAAAVSGSLFAQPERASTSPDPLRALATLYQETGRDALVSAILDEARYVARIHNGLVSADEALLLRQQTRSEKALGNDQRVWQLEQDMVTIARHNHDDIRMVPVFRELAEDRSAALEEYRAGGFPPEIELGCYYVPGLRRYDDTRGEYRPAENEGTCGSGQSASVIRRLRAETLIYYADAIEVILENREFASEELRDLERQAFRTGFSVPGPVLQKTGDWAPVSVLITPPSAAVSPCSRARVEPETLDELMTAEILGGCLAPLVHGNGLVEANVGGWGSLVRLIAYEIRSGAPSAARADALSDLADWQLISSRLDGDENSEIAIELYERAYRELGQDHETRTSMFSPEVPVVLTRNPFTSTATAGSSRYIDASLAITKYGRSEHLEIQESQGATRAEERDLTRLIKSTRFRPRFVEGTVADSAPVVVRYHLGR